MYDDSENESKSKKVKNGVQPENRKKPNILFLEFSAYTNRKLLTRRSIKLLTVKRQINGG